MPVVSSVNCGRRIDAMGIQGVKADAVPLNGQTIASKPNWTDERQDAVDDRLACRHVF
jgi:hypothetical protein